MCGDFKKIFDNLDMLCTDYLTGIEYRFPEFIKTESEKIKEKNNVLFFNDLIDRTLEALKKTSGIKFAEKIRYEFKAALIDEFQDTDKRQYEIFKTVFGDKSILFLIGDPKQSIYGFRGADVFTYIQAVKNAVNTETLQTNWRSDSELVESVNSLFGRIQNPFLFFEIQFHPVIASDKLSSFYIDDNNSSLNVFFMTDTNIKDAGLNIGTSREFADILIADEIVNILNLSEHGKAYIIDKKTGIKNKVKASDIAVLVKKNKNGITVQNMLRERGVPSVIYATESVFQSLEAEELLRIMKAVSTPSDITALKSALATSILGYSAEQIINEMKDETGHGRLSEKFKRWKGIWETSGFISMIKKLLLEEKIKSSIIKFPGGERTITNIGHLAELIHEAEENSNKNIDGSIKWLHEKILNNNSYDLNENQLRLETDENAVTIISIHKSKGLEYGFVFCPDLWDTTADNTFIKYHENFEIILDIAPDDDAENISEYESLAEELRVMYVALTRARYRSYLTWGKIKRSYNSAAAYLFHSPVIFNPDEKKKRPELINKETEIVNMISELKNIKGMNVCVKNIQTDINKNIIKKTPLKKEKEEKHIFREIDFSINNGFKIFSYSSLVKKNSKEEKDRDAFFHIKLESSKSIINNTGIIQFPKGAVSGNYFHEIFEEADYQDNESIKKTALLKIQKYMISEEWLPSAIETVTEILNIEIKSEKNSFKLNQLGFSSRLNELEFYFPLKNFNSNEFMEFLNLFEKNIKTETIPEIIQSDGFIKGFIDLVAENNGRYYIFDWKTNHLGDLPDDYNPESIKSAMIEGNYFIQAIIYSLAVHRYLESRIKDYSYSKHFGGAYYVFTRGVASGYDSSIYHFYPEEELIKNLSIYINGGN
jgi:exodeoxyribonuclease V beta subunit